MFTPTKSNAQPRFSLRPWTCLDLIALAHGAQHTIALSEELKRPIDGLLDNVDERVKVKGVRPRVGDEIDSRSGR
ncbi:hypothetical protein [Luteimonas sp. RC10]|uniref:hypothetical protein n=1 Tax=Luteimonas sp. RC10 TaxID=2587035 RepID=UPI0016088E6A|nr:hypothetical protein [Luteimonas sp. RC10]MBB3343060.1 hypothetical protein [Luteimonas sp. RC10]